MIAKLGGDTSKLFNLNPSGSKFIVTTEGKRNILHKYLSTQQKNWKISFKNIGYDFIEPLAINTDKDIVAFSIKGKSVNVFVPWMPNGKKAFWETISSFLLEQYKDFKSVKEWVLKYKIPKLTQLEKSIYEKQKSIDDLLKEKQQLESEKEKYDRIRNVLLFFDGDILHDVCREVLNELGIDVEDGKIGREDLVYIHDEIHFVIEVKGAEKSTNKKHIKQLGSHITEYKNEYEVEPKGVLLINPWRKLPLENRNTNDKPNFPHEIMKLVELSKFTLLTTQQLFVAYCEKLDDTFKKEEFLNKVSSTVGIMEGYNDIEKYKIL